MYFVIKIEQNIGPEHFKVKTETTGITDMGSCSRPGNIIYWNNIPVETLVVPNGVRNVHIQLNATTSTDDFVMYFFQLKPLLTATFAIRCSKRRRT